MLEVLISLMNSEPKPLKKNNIQSNVIMINQGCNHNLIKN